MSPPLLASKMTTTAWLHRHQQANVKSNSQIRSLPTLAKRDSIDPPTIFVPLGLGLAVLIGVFLAIGLCLLKRRDRRRLAQVHIATGVPHEFRDLESGGVWVQVGPPGPNRPYPAHPPPVQPIPAVTAGQQNRSPGYQEYYAPVAAVPTRRDGPPAQNLGQSAEIREFYAPPPPPLVRQAGRFPGPRAQNLAGQSTNVAPVASSAAPASADGGQRATGEETNRNQGSWMQKWKSSFTRKGDPGV